MKITFLGNFSVDYSTESHHLWTYRKLGHEVKTLQEGRTNADQILNSAIDSDLFVHTHTHGWNTPDIEKVYKILKANNIPTAGYHLDLWKGISREADLDNDPYWNIEHFFTVDQLFVQDLQKKGIKAYYLPAGVVEKECYIAKPDRVKYPHEIVFTGSKGYHHEWQYRPHLINWLKENYKDKFGHYGGDGLGIVRGDSLNQLYSSAKIVIGDTLCKDFIYPYYFSDRLFEVVGRGGFMIFPYIKGLEEMFKIDYEIVVYPFGDFEALKTIIDYYLEHDEEREVIKLAGQQRVLKEHTYTNRLQTMLDTIFQNK